jgi:hypothetical protein
MNPESGIRTYLILDVKFGNFAEIYNYSVQPLNKRASVWMNHKNPVSGDGDGVFILGIHNIYE